MKVTVLISPIEGIKEITPDNGKHFTFTELYPQMGCDMIECLGLPKGYVMLMDEDARYIGKAIPNKIASMMVGREILGTVVVLHRSLLK